MGDRGVVASLSVHVFFSWGVLYYTLPLLNLRFSETYGWSTAFIAAVFSGALLLAAIAGIPVGRLVDVYGPAPVMMCGGLVGSAAMLVSVWGTHPAVFAAAWIVVGGAHSATLYPPAFTAVARWFEGRTTRPLTVLTLSGGSSSLVFGPVSAASADSVGVTETVVILAVVYLAVVLATTAFLCRRPWNRSEHERERVTTSVTAIVRSGRFIRLQIAMALGGAALYAVTLNAVQLMVERGFTYREAAVAFGLIGGGQLIGRLLFVPLGQRGTPVQRSVGQAAAAAVSIVAMALVGAPAALVVTVAILAGAVRGTHTLITATAVMDRWGTVNYGTVFGRFNFVVAAAIAVGPVLGELLAASTGSYQGAALVLGVVALVAVPLARFT